MTVQRYLQIQQAQQQTNMGSSGQQGQHRKLDRSLSEPKSAKGQNQSTNSSRYKTELCRPFEESGTCKYGDKCQFAHGFQELRTLTRHPKYKTELCCTFHTTGLCPYGSRCHFIHNPDENRAKILPTLPLPQAMSQQHGQQLHHNKNLHGNISSQAMGMTQSQSAHQNSLRSLSIGSNGSIGSNSSGELSPSSSPGMFDDPFSPGFYGASRNGLPNPFSTFGSDFEMSTLAAAFSAAESTHGGFLKNTATSAPATPPFRSQLNLLSSTSGPWGSPSSTDMFQFPAGDMHCSLGLSQPSVNQAKLFEGQSSPVDAMSFDFDAMSLSSAASSVGSMTSGSSGLSSVMSPNSRANHSSNLTRLPIFNQLAHSD